MSRYDRPAQGYCPWCELPPCEHETRDGYQSKIYLCPRAPHDWRGLLHDSAGEPIPVAGRAA